MRRAETPRLAELSAFVDGELDAERRRAVEEHLASNPAAMTRIGAYRRCDDELRVAFAMIGHEDTGATAARLRRQRSNMRLWAVRLAAAAITLLVLGGAMWFHLARLAEERQLADLAHDAAVAHLTYLAGHAIGQPAADRAALTGELSAVVGVAAELPDLTRFGFQLEHGRQLSDGRERAVLLVYANTAGDRISCYFARVPGGDETDFVAREASGLNMVYRLDEGVAYAVVGGISTKALQKIARSGYAWER